ncbi:MAG: hypothetical protein A2Z99_21000 [Treponema sp. GWB1_62_6]|nr:MAG: hypothetical protein A2Z99_21000 [Treponema sp. GWB1_62_6]
MGARKSQLFRAPFFMRGRMHDKFVVTAQTTAPCDLCHIVFCIGWKGLYFFKSKRFMHQGDYCPNLILQNICCNTDLGIWGQKILKEARIKG